MAAVLNQKAEILTSKAPEHLMQDGTLYKGRSGGTWIKIRVSYKELLKGKS